jgi:hypothetical protein
MKASAWRSLLLAAGGFALIAGAWAEAERCERHMQVRGAADQSACLTELRVSRMVDPAWKATVGTLVGRGGQYFVAASKSASCSAVAYDKVSHMPSVMADDLSKSRALDNCRAQGCECEIILGTGAVFNPESPHLRTVAGANRFGQISDAQTGQAAISSSRVNELGEEFARQVFGRLMAQISGGAAGAPPAGQPPATDDTAARPQPVSLPPAPPAPATGMPGAQRQSTESVAQREPAAISPGRRVALVIGNSAYAGAPLANPSNDARDMAAALGRAGFTTILALDATLPQMREATRRFSQAADRSDAALIYFAGHGIEAKGRNYLIPVGADVKFEYELADQAFDTGVWLDMLDSVRGDNPNRVNVLILDACRNNEFARGWRSSGKGLGRLDAPSGTFIAFSTAPGRVAEDGVGQRNSPFTRHLLSEMQAVDQPIELVFKEVRRKVMSETRGQQVPWDNSSLVGHFSFVPRTAK